MGERLTLTDQQRWRYRLATAAQMLSATKTRAPMMIITTGIATAMSTITPAILVQRGGSLLIDDLHLSEGASQSGERLGFCRFQDGDGRGLVDVLSRPTSPALAGGEGDDDAARGALSLVDAPHLAGLVADVGERLDVRPQGLPFDHLMTTTCPCSLRRRRG